MKASEAHVLHLHHSHRGSCSSFQWFAVSFCGDLVPMLLEHKNPYLSVVIAKLVAAIQFSMEIELHII